MASQHSRRMDAVAVQGGLDGVSWQLQQKLTVLVVLCVPSAFISLPPSILMLSYTEGIIVISTYRGGNQGTGMVSSLLKVTHLGESRAGILMHLITIPPSQYNLEKHTP